MPLNESDNYESEILTPTHLLHHQHHQYLSTNETSIDLDLGPQRDPLITAIPMTIVYALILITGFIGNVSTCFVISKNKYMHTATNYYLFSLAVSDLLLLVLGLPQEMFQIWLKYPYLFGEYFCFLRGMTSEMSTNASVLTITAFTVERYLAICHPLKAHTMSKLSRVIKMIIIVWIVSAICAAPLAYHFGIVFDYFQNKKVRQSASCSIARTLPFVKEHVFAISTFLVFVIPISIISVLYMLIGLKLRRSSSISYSRNDHDITSNITFDQTNHEHNGSGTALNACNGSPLKHRISFDKRALNGSSCLSQRHSAVIKMLIAVVVAFFICFAPFHAQRLMAIYVKEPTLTQIIFFNFLTYISGITYYVSATINPILYSIMSLKFRQAFKETLGRCCGNKDTNRFDWKNASEIVAKEDEMLGPIHRC